MRVGLDGHWPASYPTSVRVGIQRVLAGIYRIRTAMCASMLGLRGRRRMLRHVRCLGSVSMLDMVRGRGM
jgi:hypothetical protein